MPNAKLAATVTALRESKGWTQEHLAQIADVSARTIQRVESQGTASQETLQAIACAFGVDVKTLLEGVDNGANGPDLLIRVVQERQLERLMGCHAIRLDHDDVRDDEEREQIGSLFTSIRDWNDIWSDIAPSNQLDAAHSMFDEVQRLDALGLWTFAIRRIEKMRLADGTDMDLDVSIIVVQRHDHPAVISFEDSETAAK